MPAWSRTLVASAAVVALMSVPARGALDPVSRAGLPSNFDIRSTRRAWRDRSRQTSVPPSTPCGPRSERTPTSG